MNRRQFLIRFVTALSLFLAVASTFAAQERAGASTPGAAADCGVQPDRLAWFREARFGMFIHWGPYSELAGEWNGQRVEVGRNAEWIVKFLQIPAAEYRELARQFNPVKFDAEAWVRLAQATGMRHLVVTAKHHDGFRRRILCNSCAASSPPASSMDAWGIMSRNSWATTRT